MRLISSVVAGALIASASVPLANAAEAPSRSSSSMGAVNSLSSAPSSLEDAYPTLFRMASSDMATMPREEAAALVRKLEATGELRHFMADERFGDMRTAMSDGNATAPSLQVASLGWREKMVALAIIGVLNASGLPLATIIDLVSNTSKFLNWCSKRTICAGLVIGIPTAVITQILTYVREEFQKRRGVAPALSTDRATAIVGGL